MKKILVLSGKGGTGKTTAAAAFIAFLNAKAYADCDVDAPNLHLIQRNFADEQRHIFYGSKKAEIDAAKCTFCGICRTKCRFEAIKMNKAHYEIDEYACEGCGVCEISCPARAISLVDDAAGDLMLYKKDAVFSTAKLKMGRGNSGKLVSAVKKQLAEHADAEICVIDGSPGIGCPVIASVSGVDLVLIVAEPSLSGISDMKRILKTINGFGVPAAVCVNKYDASIQKTKEIKDFCAENNLHFAGQIPYDMNVSQAINNEKSIADVDCPARDALKQVFNKTMELLAQSITP